MGALKIFGGISVVIGIFTAIVGVWLLASSLMLDCATFGYGYQFGTYRYNNRFSYNGGGSYSGSYGRGYMPLGYDRDRSIYDPRYTNIQEYYNRHRDQFCLEIVPNWITASAIGMSVGVLQLVLSVVFVIRERSKPLTIIWSIFHFIFLIGIIVSLALSIAAYVYDFYEVQYSGKLFLGVLALNGALSFLLPCIACWKAMNMGKSHTHGGGGIAYEAEPIKKQRTRNY